MPNTLSLLKYPKGKTRLRDFIKENVIKNHCENGTYIEPFVAGFSVGLYLLENNIVEKVVLNEPKKIYSKNSTNRCDT